MYLYLLVFNNKVRCVNNLNLSKFYVIKYYISIIQGICRINKLHIIDILLHFIFFVGTKYVLCTAILIF